MIEKWVKLQVWNTITITYYYNALQAHCDYLLLTPCTQRSLRNPSGGHSWVKRGSEALTLNDDAMLSERFWDLRTRRVYSVCKIGQNVWDSRQLATISHFLYPTRELNLSEVALTKIRFIPNVILQALSGTCSQKWCIKAKGEHNWKTRSFISKPPGKQDLFEDFQPETHSFNIQLHVSRFLKHILRGLPSQFAQPHQRQRGSDVEGLHLLCTARSCVRC